MSTGGVVLDALERRCAAAGSPGAALERRVVVFDVGIPGYDGGVEVGVTLARRGGGGLSGVADAAAAARLV